MLLIRWGPSWAGRIRASGVHDRQLLCMWQKSMLCPRWELACTVGGASMVFQMVKSWPAVQETQVPSLGQEESLEKGMATHSSILASKIPLTEERGGLQSMRSQRVGHDWATSLSLSGFSVSFNQVITHVPVTVLSVLHVELHPVILTIIPFYRWEYKGPGRLRSRSQ